MHNFDNKGFQRLPEEENDYCTNQDPPQATPYEPPPLKPYYDDPNHDPHDGTSLAPLQVPPYQPLQPQPYYDDPNRGPQAWGPDTQNVMTSSSQTMPPMQGQRPTDWTVPAWVACLLCCMPLGLAAVSYANTATALAEKGKMVEARKAAGTAKTLTIAAFVAGPLILIGVIGWTVWTVHTMHSAIDGQKICQDC